MGCFTRKYVHKCRRHISFFHSEYINCTLCLFSSSRRDLKNTRNMHMPVLTHAIQHQLTCIGHYSMKRFNLVTSMHKTKQNKEKREEEMLKWSILAMLTRFLCSHLHYTTEHHKSFGYIIPLQPWMKVKVIENRTKCWVQSTETNLLKSDQRIYHIHSGCFTTTD